VVGAYVSKGKEGLRPVVPVPLGGTDCCFGDGMRDTAGVWSSDSLVSCCLLSTINDQAALTSLSHSLEALGPRYFDRPPWAINNVPELCTSSPNVETTWRLPGDPPVHDDESKKLTLLPDAPVVVRSGAGTTASCRAVEKAGGGMLVDADPTEAKGTAASAYVDGFACAGGIGGASAAVIEAWSKRSKASGLSPGISSSSRSSDILGVRQNCLFPLELTSRPHLSVLLDIYSCIDAARSCCKVLSISGVTKTNDPP
jgi:hypothetical protein